MIRSETLDALATALAKAQGEFEAVAKTSENPFFKSKYAALPDVVEAAQPILTKHGLSVTHFPGIGEDGSDTLTTILMHSSGQFLGDTMRLHLLKDRKTGEVTSQAHGSSTTYGRHYAFTAALNLVADEDDDGNAGSKPGGQQAKASTQPRQIQKWQAETLAAVFAERPGSFTARIDELFPVEGEQTIPERVLSLTDEQADQLIKAVQK